MRKLKTINLSGKEYAQVSERLRAIHEDHNEVGAFDIITNYDVTESGIVFTAKITIRDKETASTFVGHSYGKTGASKAFEKLETIAVGRALAFAGYHADGEIASADEMEDHKQDVDTEALAQAISIIKSSNTPNALKKAYDQMPLQMKQNKDVIEAGKTKKAELVANKKKDENATA
jgi:hypothetical protein